jgi:pyruvate dehydrogenase E1 component alpha subunit/2-oxoisovalerate dehydrogenase E1 component alpha subunit
MLLRGYPLDRFVAQWFGAARDEAHGRQMPAHPFSRAVNQVSWGSCVGTQIPQAVGASFAAKRLGQATVVMCFLGDGATSEADFHYGMNFAGVWRAPCVFVCQNNQWAISESVEQQTANTELYKKADAYGFPGVRVDGNDVVAVYLAAREAVERARGGGGPTFLELLTYRAGAHSTSDDPSVYRDERKAKRWFARHDPLARARRRCEAAGVLTVEDIAASLRELDAAFDAVVAEIETSPPPPTITLFTEVYAGLPAHLRAQAEEFAVTGHPPPHGGEDHEPGF